MIELENYVGGILDGKIVACDKMKRQSERIIEAYLNPKQFHHDHEIASRDISFMQTFCKNPSSRRGRKQKDMF